MQPLTDGPPQPQFPAPIETQQPEPSPRWSADEEVGLADDDEPVGPGIPLVPPPREVPGLVKLSCIFGGVFAQMGWIFFGLGMVFVWVFGPEVDLSPWWTAAYKFETTQGVVTDVRSSNFTINDQPVFAHTYVYFSPAGGQFTGVSHATGRKLDINAEVEVQYATSRPLVSRIRGMRAKPAPIWVLAMVGIFPLIGLVFILVALPPGIRGARLLSTGRLTDGRLLDVKATGTRVNRRPVMKMTFEFKDEAGQLHQTVAKTHEAEKLRDQKREALLYDPAKPTVAALLDNLPGRPIIDETGSFGPASTGKAIATLIAPMLAIDAQIICLIVRWLLR